MPWTVPAGPVPGYLAAWFHSRANPAIRSNSRKYPLGQSQGASGATGVARVSPGDAHLQSRRLIDVHCFGRTARRSQTKARTGQ